MDVTQQETTQDESPEEEAPKPVVLEMRDVKFVNRKRNLVRLHNANLLVREGELVVIKISAAQKCRDLSSMIQGLYRPQSGEVRFQDSDWHGEDFERHFRMRSRIGRVFEDQGWVQNFNVLENVTVAYRHHHPQESAEAIRRKVRTWTERLKVSAVPFTRPSFVDLATLRIYQWIRALVGEPALLILERPMKHVPIKHLPQLIELVNEVRGQGAAVIWFTDSQSDVRGKVDSPRFDYKLDDGQFQPIEEGKDDE